MRPTSSWGDLPLVLTAADTAHVLGVSKPTVYQIFNRKDFPSIRLSPNRLAVSKDSLRDWINTQSELDDNG